MKIELNNYDKILLEIRNAVTLAQNRINNTINREKVLMGWKIGSAVESYLTQNNHTDLKEALISQIEKDTSIPRSTIYQMRKFYRTYPNLKKEEIYLNWSHYRSLIRLKSDEERQFFENLALENSLSSDDLQREITKNNQVEKKPNTKLSQRKGQMFHYKLVKLEESDKKFIDCGFRVFSEIKTDLEPTLDEPIIVESKKENGVITLFNSPIPTSQIYTYKAHLNKVVDGDTLRVTLDLGFGVRHKEILRLKGINAAEMKTLAGKKSTEALKEILNDVEFLIVKTNQVDIFGRYVADVLFLKGENSEEEVSRNGIYLNQLLLDENLAEIY